MSRSALDQAGDGVGGFERGDDAFGAREETRGFERGGVGDGGVFGAAFVGEPGVLGADGGIVEAGGDGMRGGDLAVFVLQNVGVGALQDAGARAGEALMRGEARGVFAELRCRGRRLRCRPFSRRHRAEMDGRGRWRSNRRRHRRRDAWADAFRRREFARGLRGR